MRNFQFTNTQYDTLKQVALKFAPIATFIGALCIIWGIPFAEQITASLAAFDSLLGALLGVSTKNYRNEKQTELCNEDLLKDMLGFDDDLHLMGERESEEVEESEE